MTDKKQEKDLFTGKEVFVVGRDGSAIDKAIELSGFARKVIIVYKEDEMKADAERIEKATQNPKIAFMPHTVLAGTDNHKMTEEIILANRRTKKITFHKADPKDKRMGVLVCEEQTW